MIRVCTLDDLPEVGAVCVDIGGRKVAIARDSAGEVHAVDDTCSHANVSLSEGDVEGSEIECWLHGSSFDLVTGRPTSLPALIPIAVHTVHIDGNDIFVEVAGASSDDTATADSHPTQGAQQA